MTWRMADYLCETPSCPEERFEELVELPIPELARCPTCGDLAVHTIGAPMPRKLTVRPTPVKRGGYEKPAGPLAVDTRALADGMKMGEWKARRAAAWRDQTRREVKEKCG